MNCYFHPDRIAAAQCCDCGTGLCEECASKYSPPKCDKCAGSKYTTAEQNEMSVMKRNMIIGAAAGAVFYFMFMSKAYGDLSTSHSGRMLSLVLLVYAVTNFAGIPSAYKYLEKWNLGVIFKALVALNTGWAHFIPSFIKVLIYSLKSKKADK